MTGHFFSWIRIRIRGLFHLIKLLFAVEEHLCWAEFVNDNCMNTLADFNVNIGWLSKVSSCICFVHFRTRNGPEEETEADIGDAQGKHGIGQPAEYAIANW